MTEQLDGQMNMFDQDTWCGKMFPEYSVPTKEQTSKKSSRKSSGSQSRKLPMCLCLIRTNGPTADASTISWADGQLLGEYTMHSFGESPKEENVSLLSQILQDSPHPKYSLSAKACNGILSRAERRGKTLPAQLKEALENQAALTDGMYNPSTSNPQTELQKHSIAENADMVGESPMSTISFQERAGKPGGGKGILIQDEHVGALSTLNIQKVCTQGADLYNGSITGETSASIMSNTGSSATHSGPSVIALEGNGSRDSHKGDGFKESETMYTLNTVEQHGVAYEQPMFIDAYTDTVGAICARDYKGVGSQYVGEGKLVIEVCDGN